MSDYAGNQQIVREQFPTQHHTKSGEGRGLCDDPLLADLDKCTRDGMKEINITWRCIYGESSESERTSKYIESLKNFWEDEIKQLKQTKNEMITSINQTGEEVMQLEKALGLVSKVPGLPVKGPLVEIGDQLFKLLSSYQELKNERIKEYIVLQKKEEELCRILNEIPKLQAYSEETLSDINFKRSTIDKSLIKVPSTQEMIQYEQRLAELQKMKDQMLHDFEVYKRELKLLLEECGVVPLSKAERFACSLEDDEQYFPLTKTNLDKLVSITKNHRLNKEEMMREADYLRNEITIISRKMLKSAECQESLLVGRGFTKPTLEKLKENFATLKEERKLTLKGLILRHRQLLDEWWTKCCFSDAQRAEFRAYNADHYIEEVLELHELELEQLQNFYNDNKRIFELAEKHDELWSRLHDLEMKAANKDRLFSNRGGQLLQEEKERKLIYKKLPAVKAELVGLLNEFEVVNAKPFLWFGAPLLAKVELKQEEREAQKENQKKERKAANTQTVMLESRLGTRPVAVGNKRKLLTPQHSTNSTKVMKMSAHSTVSSTLSTASSKSTASTYSQKKQRQDCEFEDRMLAPAGPSYVTRRTPAKTPVRMPAISTPDNGGN